MKKISRISRKLAAVLTAATMLSTVFSSTGQYVYADEVVEEENEIIVDNGSEEEIVSEKNDEEIIKDDEIVETPSEETVSDDEKTEETADDETEAQEPSVDEPEAQEPEAEEPEAEDEAAEEAGAEDNIVVKPARLTATGSGVEAVGSYATSVTIEGTGKLSRDRVQAALQDMEGVTEIVAKGFSTVGYRAFYGQSEIKSIDLSGCTSLTEIADEAFSDCVALTAIDIPSTVTKIGGWAFHNCGELTDFELPSSLTEIGEEAFEDCQQLTSDDLELPETLTSIGNDAFRRCISLTSATIPDSVTSIGEGAFTGCTALTSVSFPSNSSFTQIAPDTFWKCSSLESVTIPDTVTSIGTMAFADCAKLTSVTIGKGVTSISDSYEGSASYGSFARVGSNGSPATLTNNSEVASPSSSSEAWYGGYFTIPLDSVSLSKASTELAIGETETLTVTCSPADAMAASTTWESDNKTAATVTDGVITALATDTANITVTVTDNDGKEVADTCKVTVTKRTPTADDFTLDVTTGKVSAKSGVGISDSEITNYYTKDGSNWTTTKPTSSEDTWQVGIVTTANEYYNSVETSASPFTDDSWTYVYATYYTVTFDENGHGTAPDSQKIAEGGHAANPGDLTDDFYEFVGWYKEAACTNAWDFENDTVSDDMTLYAEWEESRYAYDDTTMTIKAITGDDELTQDIVDEGLEGHSEITKVIVTGYSLIGSKAFYRQSKTYKDNTLTDIEITDTATCISDNAFEGCTGLTKIVLPDTLTSINYCAFLGCIALSDISTYGLTGSSIPTGVNNIESQAFSGCTAITEITIPENITEIAYAAFNACTKLTSITIPDKVTTIGKEAFKACTHLTTVTIGKGVTSIDNTAFTDVGSSTSPATLINKSALEGPTSSTETWYGGYFKEGTKVTGVTLDKNTANLVPGETIELTATVAPDDASNKDVTWASSDDTVASVDSDGKVTALADGTADITVTTDDGGYTADCSVTVEQPAPEASDFTFTAPASLTYDGTAKEATVTSSKTGMGEVTDIRYYTDAACETEDTKHTDAKIYYVAIDVAAGDIYAAATGLHDPAWNFTVAKATPTADDFTFTAPSDLTYDSTSKEAAVTSSKSGMGDVTLKYYTDEACTQEDTEHADAKTYYVAADVAEGSNYNSASGLHLTAWKFTVAKANPTADDFTYDGTSGDVTAKEGIELGDITNYYKSIDGGSWTSEKPTTSGKYVVGVATGGNSNYETIGSEEEPFTADWYLKIGVVDVTYDANGHGTAPDSEVVPARGKITEPADPTAEGYTFGGWYTEEECENAWDFDDPVDEDTTLYAKWTVNTYSIEFDGNDATSGSMADLDMTYGVSAKLTANAYERAGFAFTEWNTEADGSGTAYANKAKVINLTLVDGDTVTLYAQWSPVDYTIEYDANSGSGSMDSQTCMRDVYENLTANAFKKSGYVFAGWNTAKDGSGTAYKNKAKVKNLAEAGKSITLYAQWEEARYTINYNANSGSGYMEAQSCKRGKYVKLTDNAFTRSGYVFAGWNTAKDGSGKAYKNKAKVKNLAATGKSITLYAQWNKKYSITYVLNGGKNNSANPSYYTKGKIIRFKKPTRSGYTFKGWYSDAAFTKQLNYIGSGTSGNITVYAKWESTAQNQESVKKIVSNPSGYLNWAFNIINNPSGYMDYIRGILSRYHL